MHHISALLFGPFQRLKKMHSSEIEVTENLTMEQILCFKTYIMEILYINMCVCVCVCVCAQSCLTLHHSMDCSPPGSSVCGILQARILEWVGISFSRGSSLPRGQTHVSCVSFIGRQILYHCTTWKSYVDILSLKAWIFSLISVPPPFHLG